MLRWICSPSWSASVPLMIVVVMVSQRLEAVIGRWCTGSVSMSWRRGGRSGIHDLGRMVLVDMRAGRPLRQVLMVLRCVVLEVADAVTGRSAGAGHRPLRGGHDGDRHLGPEPVIVACSMWRTPMRDAGGVGPRGATMPPGEAGVRVGRSHCPANWVDALLATAGRRWRCWRAGTSVSARRRRRRWPPCSGRIWSRPWTGRTTRAGREGSGDLHGRPQLGLLKP